MDKQNPKIRFVLSDAGDFVEVEISDNGKGIEKKDLPNILKDFSEQTPLEIPLPAVPVIGLSIVKKIIEDSGGRIWAESVLGEGTSIHFVLRKCFSQTMMN